MKIALGWLAEYVDLPATVEELVDRLTLGGLEIEHVERSGPDLSEVRVAHVLERVKHPGADRLSLCKVDVGDGAPVDIVCGAPNVDGGQKVAVALPGTTLPDGTRLKKTKIRGVVSNGMICSESELGLGEGHEGILVLEDEAPVGAPLADVLHSGDTLLEVEITPNRGDWASMLGIAREVRAHFGGPLRLPECQPDETGPSASDAVAIQIDDAEGCHRYVGRVVRGVRVGPSPDWLATRLEAAGLRPINNVVDVTNLVLLEFGQPLHAFDLSTLNGARVHVRGAARGEKLVTLDGQVRVLEPEDLVIADAERAIALAGVMGGAETEVREATTDVLLESAHFQPARVRRTARRLGLSTEASYRFERGVDRAGVERACDRAARLLAEVAGGRVAPERVVATGADPSVTTEIDLDPARVNRLLGTDLTVDEVASVLRRQDLEVDDRGAVLTVAIPSYRNDLHAPIDLIEEVARIYGYDRIAASLPSGPLSDVHLPPLRSWLDRSRDSLCASGLCEVMTFPALRAGDPDRLRLGDRDPRRSLVHLENPLVEDEAILRSTLLPGLLRVVHGNLSRQVDHVPVFEAGPRFEKGAPGELPDERVVLAAAITDADGEGLWDGDAPPLFFQAKGILEQLFDDLGVDVEWSAGSDEPYLHPGAACSVRGGGRVVAVLGELHPEALAAFELGRPCAVFEVDLQALPELPARAIRYQEVSRQPQVRRDLAYLFDAGCQAGELLAAIRKTGGSTLVSVALFDRYEGKGVPDGKLSLAFRLVFQRSDRTLTDEEVNKQVDRVDRMLTNRFGGERR